MTIHGGRIEDFGHLPRKWPGSEEKRIVRVSIMRYYGIGEHYYTSVTEEHNPVWDAAEGTWRYPWADVEGRGRSYYERCWTVTEANKFIAKTLQEFPDHKVEWDDNTQERFQFYYAGKHGE